MHALNHNQQLFQRHGPGDPSLRSLTPSSKHRYPCEYKQHSVCVCVCVSAFVCVCERARVYACMYECVYVCVCVLCMCVSVGVCVCVCMSMCVCVCVCVCARVYSSRHVTHVLTQKGTPKTFSLLSDARPVLSTNQRKFFDSFQSAASP